jgi:hypothetical protein
MPRRPRRLPHQDRQHPLLPRAQQDKVVRAAQPKQHHHIHRRVEARATQDPPTRRTPLPDPHTRHLHPRRHHSRPRHRHLSRRSTIRTLEPSKCLHPLQSAQGNSRTSRRSSQPRTTTSAVEAGHRAASGTAPMTASRGGLPPPPAPSVLASSGLTLPPRARIPAEFGGRPDVG